MPENTIVIKLANSEWDEGEKITLKKQNAYLAGRLHQYEKMEDLLRQTGRTSYLISTCPKGAIYIVHNSQSIRYALQVASKLGRQDVTFMPLAQLTPEWVRFGPNVQVVLDHACLDQLDERNLEALREIEIRNEREERFQSDR